MRFWKMLFLGLPLVVICTAGSVQAEIVVPDDCDVEVGCSDDEPVGFKMQVETLSYDDFFKIYSEDKLKYTLVDVRPQSSYNHGHIPGAKSLFVGGIPLEEIGQALPNKDQVVIVYCASQKCNMSHFAALKLMNAGYKKVFDFKGGIYEWLLKGNATDSIPTEQPVPSQ